MHEFGKAGFQRAFWVQGLGAGLGQSPKDADQGHGKGGNADGLVNGKQLGLGGKFGACGVGHVIGDNTQRDG